MPINGTELWCISLQVTPKKRNEWLSSSCRDNCLSTTERRSVMVQLLSCVSAATKEGSQVKSIREWPNLSTRVQKRDLI